MHAVSWGILTFCSHGVPCSPHYLWTATFTNIMMAKHYCVPPWNIWSFQTHSTSLTCVVMRQFLEIYFWQFWNQSTSEDKYDDQLNISTRGNRSNGFETENISKNRIDELNLISKLGGWLKTLPRIALISFLCVRFEKLIVVQLPILIQVVLLDRLSWSMFQCNLIALQIVLWQEYAFVSMILRETALSLTESTSFIESFFFASFSSPWEEKHMKQQIKYSTDTSLRLQ